MPEALHAARCGTKTVTAPVQLACSVMVHVAPRQQAPVEIGQRLGRQPVPDPRKVLPAGQLARVTIVQAPEVAQQAPVGCGQVTPVHTVAAPCHVPGQSAETVRAQLPSL